MLSQLLASAAQCNNCATTAQAANSAASQGGIRAYKELNMLCQQLQLTTGLVTRLNFSPLCLLLCMPGLVLLTICFVLVQYECENVLNDAALMEACGVGLSRTDMYGVMMVCKQLGEDPKLGVTTVRFFGKVLIPDTSPNV